MTERLLQYIWQYQHYNHSELTTSDDEPLQIIQPGILNTNQGPDFLNARIMIGSTMWVGSIELHINSSDWKSHKHDQDKNYQNVVLHVVWHHDAEIELSFPTLQLQGRVSGLLLTRYDQLMRTPGFIPCQNSIHHADALTWASWKDRLLAERLIAKTREIFVFLKKNKNHWEETLWWMIARNFGLKVNSETFLEIACSIPLRVLANEKKQIHRIESILFGQAGLLDGDFIEDYPKMLQKEYLFIKRKYGLKPVSQKLVFLRMRPSNFPTLRLAQLAMLVHETQHLFSRIRTARSLDELKRCLQITANDYWHYHYRFDEPAAFKEKKLGEQMIHNILTNTVIPIVFAYGDQLSEYTYKNKALEWLNDIPAEKNTITTGFETLGIANKNTFDSQALLQLKKQYCDPKRCLDCMIWNKLFSTSSGA